MPSNSTGSNRTQVSRTKPLVILIAALFGIVVCGYALANQPIAKSSAEISGIGEKQTITLHALWENYPTIRDLAGNSTDIVVGQVTDIKRIDDKSQIPTTDYNFRVDSVLKGNANQGETITIRQTGAEGAEIIIELDDDPLLKAGESFVGFLSYSKDFDVYPIVGGPQGRYLLQDDTVNSLDTVNPQAEYIAVKVHDKNLGQFLQEVESEASGQ